MAMMGSGSAAGEDRAREAAEQAINSPLLEDIDLAGAHGVLVNITAGLDMSIGEFDEVGTTIKEFADDEATVVVGTVIDPEMGDQLRVTVVATGLGKEGRPAVAPVEEVAQVRLVSNETPEPVREREPAVVNEHPTHATATTRPTETAVGGSYNEPAKKKRGMDYLDIPAFLRRQAD